MPEKMRIFSSVEDVYKALDEGISIDHKFNYSHPIKTNGTSKKLSLGRIWWNLLLPSDFPLVDEPVKRKDASKTIKKIEETFTPEEASDYVTKINKETFRLSSYVPTTFSIDSTILSDEVKEEKEQIKNEEVTSIGDFNNKVSKITKEVISEMDKKGCRTDNIRVSGGKAIPWDQLLVAQGYVGDIEGNILGPIKTAISDGHNPADFYKSAAEARNGFYLCGKISNKV